MRNKQTLRVVDPHESSQVLSFVGSGPRWVMSPFKIPLYLILVSFNLSLVRNVCDHPRLGTLRIRNASRSVTTILYILLQEGKRQCVLVSLDGGLVGSS